MPTLRIANGYGLTYKEITHRTDKYRHGWVWTPSHTAYRWEKRLISKNERRNARIVVSEYDDNIDWGLYDALMFQLAVATFAMLRGWDLFYLDEQRYVPATRNCHCATCVKIRCRPM